MLSNSYTLCATKIDILMVLVVLAILVVLVLLLH